MTCGSGRQFLGSPHEPKFDGTGKFTIRYPKRTRRYAWYLVPVTERKKSILTGKLKNEVLRISLNMC
jgi:hypothetical protein